MGEYDITEKLRDCLSQLVNGKATEKKKQADDLKTFISQPAYVNYLNKSSLRKKSGGHSGTLCITWKIIFNKIKDYIEQESHKFKEKESTAQNLSATIKTNLMKEKRKCVDLFRTFVKSISLGNQWDIANPITDHVLAVLNDSYTRVAFGSEYSNIFCKYILTNHFMCLHINASSFDHAIGFYCKIAKTPPVGWDRGHITQVLLHLLLTRLDMGSFETARMFDFFAHMFEHIKNEKVSSHHENLLKCLLHVCKTLGIEHRLRLCQLGETIMSPIMQLLKTRPSEICSELMLEFISFQMAVHHPKGATDEDKGARAHDWNLWKSHLLSMYKILIMEMYELCERNKYSSCKETVLKPIFVSVLVEVLSQVFVDAVGVLDVTQLSSTHDGNVPLKKRRIEVCFRTLTEALTSPRIIPWLQVISSFIKKYPEVMSINDAEHLLDTLISINLSCTQFETKGWLLICFQSFANSFGVKNSEEFLDTNFQWQKLWDLAVKSVALMHQCQEEAHNLLAILLSQKLVAPKLEFYNLYKPGSSNRVTSSSLKTLRIFLDNCENPSGSKYWRNNIDNSCSTFEDQVIDWLFAKQSDEITPFQVLLNETDGSNLEDFANVLVLLCLKSNDLNDRASLSKDLLDVTPWISQIEEEIMTITFDVTLHHTKAKKQDISLKVISDATLNINLWKKVLNAFIAISSHLFEEHTYNQEHIPSLLIKHAFLFFEVLQVSYFVGAEKPCDLQNNLFISYIKKFLIAAYEIEMKKETKHLSQNKTAPLFTNFLKNIVLTFSKISDAPQLKEASIFIDSISSAIPQDMLKLLLEYSLENAEETQDPIQRSINNISNNGSGSRPKKKRRYADFDDDDSEEEPLEECLDVNMDVDDIDVISGVTENSSGFYQQLNCLEILGKYISFLDNQTDRDTSFIEMMVKKLISLISAKTQNCKKVEDIKLILMALKCLLLNKQFNNASVECTLSAMRFLLNTFWAMQNVCVSVLELFPLLFNHLIENVPSGLHNVSTHKSHMFHLLRILSQKSLDQNSSSKTSYFTVKILASLLQIEPTVSWPDKKNLSENSLTNNLVIRTLFQFLSSNFTSVRLYVATNICLIISSSVLDSVFSLACSEILAYLEKNSEDISDACINRISTFLHFLTHSMLQFPCLEKECLLLMCKISRCQAVDQLLVVKILSHISTSWGFDSIRNFVEPHLVYLCTKWIEEKYSFESFPFSIVEVESLNSFMCEFYKVLVPIFFFNEDFPSISKIGDSLHFTNSELMYACLPNVQAIMLADIICLGRNSERKTRTLLNSLVTSEVCEKVFLLKLDEVVVHLLSMLNDEENNHLSRCGESNLNRSLTVQQFSAVICHIVANAKFEGSFITYLNQKQDRIQSIFLSLSVMLSKVLKSHDGGKIFQMYKCFLGVLLPELTPKLTCGSFIVKELVYSLTNFLTRELHVIWNDRIIAQCCEVLSLLCSSVVKDFRDVIGDFLPFTVSSLIPFVSENETGRKVLSFLHLLIVENERHLAEYIKFLDPFPDAELFQDLAERLKSIKYKGGIMSLSEEINIFLKSCKMMNKATLEGLQHLCYQLTHRRPELLEILNKLKENALFSEDVKRSLIHQLICQLASLCSRADSQLKIKEAASKCLGVIGPIALSSVVLQSSSFLSSSTTIDVDNLNSVQQSYAVILNSLCDYLFDKRIDIKVCVSGILKDLLGTKTAYCFFERYQNLRPNNSLYKFGYCFYACQNSKILKTTCQYNCQLHAIQEKCLWIPEKKEHSEWITKLVCSLIESGLTKNNFYECLIPICKKEVPFCETILPFIIHATLLHEDEDVLSAISSGINIFFSNFSSWLQAQSGRNGNGSSQAKPSTLCKRSLRTMLTVVHHVWLNHRAKNQRNILKDFWLDIDFLEVAQAARYCSAYFTAIMYTELWCDYTRERARQTDPSAIPSDSSGSLDCSPLSFISNGECAKASSVYDILRETYSQIGDFDAISGCDVISADSQSILKHSYMVDKKWDGLLRISNRNNSSLEILQALQQSSLNSVLQGYIHSLMNHQDPHLVQSISKYQYEAAWRLGQWDLPITLNSNAGFQECLYSCQQSLMSEKSSLFKNSFQSALETQYQHLRHISLEASRNIHPVLSNLQMLSVLNDISCANSKQADLQEILDLWQQQETMPYDDFEFVEPIYWLKCVLLKHTIESNSSKLFQERNTLISELKRILESHVIQAREELHLEPSSNALRILRSLPCVEEDILRWQIEEAKILWTNKEFQVASKILKSSLPSMERFSKENPKFLLHYGMALNLGGTWLAETCNENSAVIMQDYLEKALVTLTSVKMENDSEWATAVCNAHLSVAKYADSQYQSLVKYKNSTSYQMKLELITTNRDKAKQIKLENDDQKKLKLTLERQANIDQEELNTVESEKKQFLVKAITNYLHCLRGSETHDLWTFRLISLWFQNLDVEEINNIMKDKIQGFPTYKFLPLMYQLAARMGTQASSVFTNTLIMLIKKIALNHPHHSLPVILALSNADKDPVSAKKEGPQTAHLQQAEVPAVKERMIAAKKVLSSLQKTAVSSTLRSYIDICDAYISLAYLPIDKNTKKDFSIPNDHPILKLRNLVNIPIITEETKVDRSCEYKNIIGIHSFHSKYRMCGGITLPKVIKCSGLDGKEREQLVKGCDDLRQDAVMQQVFTLVNFLLKQRKETSQRKLHIRTYKVIPVSRRSGVLQWCEGTQVLSQYLVGGAAGGAHLRYFPKMYTSIDCKRKMMEIARHSTLPKKREIFNEICANFPPVFRYFFLENFPEPSAWFERRQSYTKSVAATSIVGYILGLGDRHVNNILVDKNTAEVVHIDFGIAFEKGRILATPETVPFRLTRDIVDGMGINGVEGTFKRCSEKTLEVMRDSQAVLLTILEVLLHDPLYEWTVPANKAQKGHPKSSSSSPSPPKSSLEVNTLAERALMRLQQKLQGVEDGVAMSIEGQVNLLIQQARDYNRLCRLYVGWQPYL